MLRHKAFLSLIMPLFMFTLLTAAGESKKVTVRVDGLACPFCAYGLEKKLKKIDGVDKLEIKINDGLVTLHFKPYAKIDKALISKKVKEAGFTPKEVTVEGESIERTVTMKGQQITLNIKGMTCEGCVSRVEKALNKIDCVDDVEVSLADEQARFVCADEKTDPAKFVQAIEKLGFKAEVADKNDE
ncbi:MAG: heavy-metal-associated domain-containing protein [bacterium]